MRIAIFSDSFLPGVGGTEKAVLGLAEALQKTKLEASKTPKSISDVTSIKLPVIAKDFPEFCFHGGRLLPRNQT